eukprot:6474290-Amphidinium_carterae.2
MTTVRVSCTSSSPRADTRPSHLFASTHCQTETIMRAYKTPLKLTTVQQIQHFAQVCCDSAPLRSYHDTVHLAAHGSQRGPGRRWKQ